MRLEFRALWMGLLGFASSGTGVSAQVGGGQVTIGTDLPVNIGLSDWSLIEPHLAVNPQNPRHLVGAFALVGRISDPRQRATVPDVHRCAAIASFDSGLTWSRREFPESECLDPWVVVLADGSAVFSGLSGGKTFTYRSADGGATWSSEPVVVMGNSDHGTMAVDPSRTGGAQAIYSIATQNRGGPPRRASPAVSRSDDGGRTFSEIVHITPFNLRVTAMNPVVLSDGTLVVPYVGFSRTRAGGGTDFFQNALAWVSLSGDRGRSFGEPRFVTNACASGFSEIAAHPGPGPFRDRLYWVCNDRLRRNIYLVHSSDRGETWSDPLELSRSPANNPYVAHPVVAISPEGTVGVSWYDARNDPREYMSGLRCKDVYFASSIDGGASFSQPVKVSSQESCSATPENGEAGMRWSAGGDYHGLVATGPSTFRILFSSSRTGRFELRTAQITVSRPAER